MNLRLNLKVKKKKLTQLLKRGPGQDQTTVGHLSPTGVLSVDEPLNTPVGEGRGLTPPGGAEPLLSDLTSVEREFHGILNWKQMRSSREA